MADSTGGVYAVIMAGGVGSRFWPLSRRDRPKQFLDFFGERSLLRMASDRLDGLIPPERRLILTNERYIGQTAEQLPDLPSENILAEPISRNTAPAIAFGAVRIADLNPEGIMLVLPADHLIQDVPAFHEAIQKAVGAARDPGVLITMGIRPAYPATGYGYIEYDPGAGEGGAETSVFDVISFTEKPDESTAEEFVNSGRYLWNSGMFCWRADSILDEIERHLPQVHEAFSALSGGDWDDGSVVAGAFEASPTISIDFGVMERAERVRVVPCDIGWSDVGDWQAAYELSPKDADGNAVRGDVRLLDATGCFAYSSSRQVVLLGTKDLVVVDAGDAVLVCDRAQAQRVKEAAKAAEAAGEK